MKCCCSTPADDAKDEWAEVVLPPNQRSQLVSDWAKRTARSRVTRCLTLRRRPSAPCRRLLLFQVAPPRRLDRRRRAREQADAPWTCRHAHVGTPAEATTTTGTTASRPARTAVATPTPPTTVSLDAQAQQLDPRELTRASSQTVASAGGLYRQEGADPRRRRGGVPTTITTVRLVTSETVKLSNGGSPGINVVIAVDTQRFAGPPGRYGPDGYSDRRPPPDAFSYPPAHAGYPDSYGAPPLPPR